MCHQNHLHMFIPSTENYNPILKYPLSIFIYLFNIQIPLNMCQILSVLKLLTHLFFLTAHEVSSIILQVKKQNKLYLT
jgi:hypothetical protein